MTQTEIHDNKMSTLSKCILMDNIFKFLNHTPNNLVHNYMQRVICSNCFDNPSNTGDFWE